MLIVVIIITIQKRYHHEKLLRSPEYIAQQNELANARKLVADEEARKGKAAAAEAKKELAKTEAARLAAFPENEKQ